MSRWLVILAVLPVFIAGCATVPPGEELPPAEIPGETPPKPPPQHRPLPSTPKPPRPIPTPPSIPPQAVPAKLPFRDVVAIQTLLDRANFSCGVEDGKLGTKTHTALRAWQRQNGLVPTGNPDADTLQRLGDLGKAFTTTTVTADDVASLAPLPKTWRGKSAVPRLGYETVLELVAERSHAAEDAIRQLNPGAAWPSPPAGTVLTVPDPRPFPVRSASKLTISLGQKILRAYDGDGTLLAMFPCSIAKDKSKRPVGQVQIVNCAANPNYTFDPALFVEDPEAATIDKRLLIPPGPNNPVGVAWISLNLPGYGIHGTPKPEDIGKTQSHGCFRLANWNAEKLLKMISIGTPVVIEE